MIKLKKRIGVFSPSFFMLLFFAKSINPNRFELAEYYYNNGSYEQALLYLGDIYKKNKTNKVYQMYYESLLAMDEFSRLKN